MSSGQIEYRLIPKSTYEANPSKEGKVFENANTLNVRNDGNVVKDATKTTQFMASSSKRVSGSGGANDSSLCEDGDYEMHDGYEDYAYDLTEEQ
ncbi:hypothetical protein Tco_0965839 [Tanacetum coccineum]